ncbi:MAG: O-antigen translocase, partial [Desulfatibacillaceae bacterium]
MTTQAASATESARASYRGVLKSTSLMGGASFIQILIRMIRVKFVAVLLGTSGVGLAGMYGQIINLATTASGMGLQGSGVKHVAESVGTGDAEQVARTAIALKRLVWVTGALGMLVLVVFSRPISVATFGTPEYTVPVAILGVVVFLTAITTGYASILRGHRRIAEIARIQVLGAVAGTVISIPCYYLWGLHGILVALVLGALVMLGINWWRARRVPIQNIHLSWKDTLAEGRGMMSLGVGLMGAALCGVVANYLIRVILIRRFDLSDVGVYQAAFNLSGVLVAFVLGAMAADYFPRLSAVASDNDEVSRVVREQAEIAVTLALPGLVAMMIFAPVIINVFYAEEFLEAVPILRWCVFGVLGRVLSWPLGFVILAKG